MCALFQSFTELVFVDAKKACVLSLKYCHLHSQSITNIVTPYGIHHLTLSMRNTYYYQLWDHHKTSSSDQTTRKILWIVVYPRMQQLYKQSQFQLRWHSQAKHSSMYKYIPGTYIITIHSLHVWHIYPNMYQASLLPLTMCSSSTASPSTLDLLPHAALQPPHFVMQSKWRRERPISCEPKL